MPFIYDDDFSYPLFEFFFSILIWKKINKQHKTEEVRVKMKKAWKKNEEK